MLQLLNEATIVITVSYRCQYYCLYNYYIVTIATVITVADILT